MSNELSLIHIAGMHSGLATQNRVRIINIV